MARLLVDVQLEVLVVVHEALLDLVYSEVEGTLLVQEVGVVTVCQGCLHLDHLAPVLLAYCVDVRILSKSSTLSKSTLHGSAGSL